MPDETLNFPYLVRPIQIKIRQLRNIWNDWLLWPFQGLKVWLLVMLYLTRRTEYFLHSFLTAGLLASLTASSRLWTMFSRVFTSVSTSMLFSLASLLSSKLILITSFGSHLLSRVRDARVAWNLHSSLLKWSPGIEKLLLSRELYWGKGSLTINSQC